MSYTCISKICLFEKFKVLIVIKKNQFFFYNSKFIRVRHLDILNFKLWSMLCHKIKSP